MEDIRIGRKATGVQDIVPVPNSSVLLIAGDPNRIALAISCPAAAAVTLSFTSPVVAAVGMRLPVDGNPFRLNIAHDGGMVKNAIYAIAAAGTENLAVWSATLGEQ